jgi:hypothetical protein
MAINSLCVMKNSIWLVSDYIEAGNSMMCFTMIWQIICEHIRLYFMCDGVYAVEANRISF